MASSPASLHGTPRIIHTALHHFRQCLHCSLLSTLEADLCQESADNHLQGAPSGHVVVLGRAGGCLASTPTLKNTQEPVIYAVRQFPPKHCFSAFQNLYCPTFIWVNELNHHSHFNHFIKLNHFITNCDLLRISDCHEAKSVYIGNVPKSVMDVIRARDAPEGAFGTTLKTVE